MFTSLFLHPALLDRFDGDTSHGGAPRDGFKPRPRGDYDNAGNYRADNVWRSAQANEAARCLDEGVLRQDEAGKLSHHPQLSELV